MPTAGDEGIAGWGEPIVEGRAETVKACVHELMEYLIGKDPMRIEDHWSMLYRSEFDRGGPILMSAIAGIDQALWDIKGKYYQAPVYQLLGGACRDSIRVYSWIGGDRPADVAEEAKKVAAVGFTAVKMNGTEAGADRREWRGGRRWKNLSVFCHSSRLISVKSAGLTPGKLSAGMKQHIPLKSIRKTNAKASSVRHQAGGGRGLSYTRGYAEN